MKSKSAVDENQVATALAIFGHQFPERCAALGRHQMSLASDKRYRIVELLKTGSHSMRLGQQTCLRRA